ncbi:MAG: hypothetical protein ABI039_07220, partial [Vicinamibacterales bacterium]
FEFERDGVPHATMLRKVVGRIPVLGRPDYRYVVSLRSGDQLETVGYVLTNWTISRADVIVARIESSGYVYTIDLLDSTDAAFVMTVVMAIGRLNKPPNVGDSPDP